jgi:hypothetical protein
MLKQTGITTAFEWVFPVLAAAVVVLLIGCSNDSSGNQTEEQLAELEMLADEVAAKGHLRPIFPSYVPEDLPATPYIIDSSDGHVAFEYWIGDREPASTLQVVSVMVAEWPRGIGLEPCELESSVECVMVSGSEASPHLATTGSGGVSYGLTFNHGDRKFLVETVWEFGTSNLDDVRGELAEESIWVAESLTQQ